MRKQILSFLLGTGLFLSIYSSVLIRAEYYIGADVSPFLIKTSLIGTLFLLLSMAGFTSFYTKLEKKFEDKI